MDGGRPCTICSHHARESIEKDLIAGKRDPAVAKAHGVDAQAVRRHRINCIPEALARARHAADVRRGDFILDEATKLLKSCQAVLVRAERGHEKARKDLLTGVPKAKHDAVVLAAETMAASDEMVLKAAREVRPSLELLGKLVGQLGENATINIHQAPDFQELRAAILEALQPHHEARLDVADAMLEFVARREVGDVEPVH